LLAEAFEWRAKDGESPVCENNYLNLYVFSQVGRGTRNPV